MIHLTTAHAHHASETGDMVRHVLLLAPLAYLCGRRTVGNLLAAVDVWREDRGRS